MRIGVIGAGAIGGAIAALAAKAGHDVEVTARGDHLDAIQGNGIQLTGEWGDFIAPVDANEKLTRVPELAIIATNKITAHWASLIAIMVAIGVAVLGFGMPVALAAKTTLEILWRHPTAAFFAGVTRNASGGSIANGSTG